MQKEEDTAGQAVVSQRFQTPGKRVLSEQRKVVALLLFLCGGQRGIAGKDGKGAIIVLQQQNKGGHNMYLRHCPGPHDAIMPQQERDIKTAHWVLDPTK